RAWRSGAGTACRASRAPSPPRSAGSSVERPAVEFGAVARIAQQEVGARNMREAAEVRHVVELLAAGGEPPVAAGSQRHRVAHRDPVANRRAETQYVDAAEPLMAEYPVAQAGALAVLP